MVHINLPGCMLKFNLPDSLFVLNDSIAKQKQPQFLDQKSPFLSLASNDASKPKRLDAPVTYGRSKHFHMFHGETVVQIGNYLETKLQNMCFFLRLEHEVEMVVVKTVHFIARDTAGGISFSERKKTLKKVKSQK